jgi:hypothetical protein
MSDSEGGEDTDISPLSKWEATLERQIWVVELCRERDLQK